MPNLSFCIFKQKKFILEFEGNIWIIYDIQSASSNLGEKHEFGNFYSQCNMHKFRKIEQFLKLKNNATVIIQQVQKIFDLSCTMSLSCM